jgi:hypothetical protein
MGILINNQFRLEAGRQLALSSCVSSERAGSRGWFRPSAIQFIHPQTNNTLWRRRLRIAVSHDAQLPSATAAIS